MILQKDIETFIQLGIDVKTIEHQIENFKKGFPFINLMKPASSKDGIIIFEKQEIEHYVKIFETSVTAYKVLKFVPASGAASRMFQNLYSFRDTYKGSEKEIKSFENDNNFNSAHRFITEIKKFAFYNELKEKLAENQIQIEDCIQNHDYTTIINCLLDEKGLGYGSLPKGLLKFHHYNDLSRTAIEEHLIEAVNYTRGAENLVSVHFTISPEHIEKFKSHIDSVKAVYEKQFNVCFDIKYSVQKPSTDVIAVDLQNEFLRDNEGKILFRPGGHGALIENLNELKCDVIFIKNIDNIVPDKLKEQTYIYKKVIGGYLMFLQQKTFQFLQLLEKNQINDEELDEMKSFAIQYLMIRMPDDFEDLSKMEKTAYLFTKFNRPIRVCGMVKNEGEPGGGPFWVKNGKGEVSLQIVESSQINLSDTVQSQLFKEATHFNPVDLVCGVKNYKGEFFDLKKFIDNSTGFITVKSKDGKSLKAQELPGLWNGAMAEWTSVFVEVPIITFNPVKTINDLLRIEHQ